MGLGKGFWIAAQPGWPDFPNGLIRMEAVRGTLTKNPAVSPLVRVWKPEEIRTSPEDDYLRN